MLSTLKASLVLLRAILRSGQPFRRLKCDAWHDHIVVDGPLLHRNGAVISTIISGSAVGAKASVEARPVLTIAASRTLFCAFSRSILLKGSVLFCVP